jgi:hypothetical protein
VKNFFFPQQTTKLPFFCQEKFLKSKYKNDLLKTAIVVCFSGYFYLISKILFSKDRIKSNNSTEFPLTPSLSPAGRGEGEGGLCKEINAFVLVMMPEQY